MRIDSHRFCFFLASIAALTSLSIDMSLPSVPMIESEFRIPAGSGGLTMSLFLAGYALTPLFGGPLADRLGRRPVLLYSLALFALSALACSLSPNFRMLLLFRLLQGCAAGVATTLPTTIVRDLFEGRAARQRMSEIATINGLMPLVAPVFGSMAMSVAGWRVLFGTQAVFASCVVLFLTRGFKESLSLDRRIHLYPRAMVGNYFDLLRNRIFLSYALINGLGFACVFSFISDSPLILMQRMGLSRSIYPVVFATIALGGVLGSFTSSIFSGRVASSRSIISIGLSLMLTGSLASLTMHFTGQEQPATIVPLFILTLFGFGLIAPSVTLGALEPIPNLAGSGSGALRSILMIFGSGSSGFLASYCARHYVHTEAATTLTMTITTLLAIALYLNLLQPASQRESTTYPCGNERPEVT